MTERKRALEEAVKLCEAIGVDWVNAGDYLKSYAADYLAERIRSLAEQAPTVGQDIYVRRKDGTVRSTDKQAPERRKSDRRKHQDLAYLGTFERKSESDRRSALTREEKT